MAVVEAEAIGEAEWPDIMPVLAIEVAEAIGLEPAIEVSDIIGLELVESIIGAVCVIIGEPEDAGFAEDEELHALSASARTSVPPSGASVAVRARRENMVVCLSVDASLGSRVRSGNRSHRRAGSVQDPEFLRGG